MCGIGGIYTAEGNSLPTAPVAALWEALEDRGGHAAGVGWLWEDADKVCIRKGKGKSSKLIREGALDMVGSITRYAMLHTRFTTHGSVHQNGNNHPVASHGIVLTHNGVVSNHQFVFDTVGTERLHDVDTECINAALRYGGPEAVYQLCEGSWSVAWVDSTESRETLHLMTNGRNPLVIGRTVDGDVVWGSNLYHLDAFDLKSHFNAVPYKVYTITQDCVIRSRWIEGAPQDARATVLGRHSHAAAWGSWGRPTTIDKDVPSRGTQGRGKGKKSAHRRPKSTKSTPKSTKQGRRNRRKAREWAEEMESHGWVWDERTNSFRFSPGTKY